MPSQKTKVVEYLFEKYWDPQSNSLLKAVITLDEVADAIRHCNQAYGTKLKSNNPANFMKDLLRGPNASANWPVSVAHRAYSGVQRTGGEFCFEFIPYLPGQLEPFPDDFPVNLSAPRYPVQSISITLVTKSLGRSDETWLIQTAVNLKVVETHFAVAGAFKLLELAHLQMGIKLRATEIDALYLGKSATGGGEESIIITCEAKRPKDPLIVSQIISQVKAAFAATKMDTVVPIALKAIKGTGFYLIEFSAIKRSEAATLSKLVLASDAIYELRPPVKGI
ncbi:hypothetical protein [Cereibacter changlensis]|uniref:hypothetical protein n=1 Tax=Cereibacter changlensis TaxID=402884 RepID=UPI004034C0E4